MTSLGLFFGDYIMERTVYVIDGDSITFYSDDDIIFHTENEHGIVFDNLTIDSNIDDYPFHDEVMKIIKDYMKTKKKLELSRVNNAINSFGNDLGKRTYTFNLDNRLRYKMKERSSNVSSFINLAIAEKLEREAL